MITNPVIPGQPAGLSPEPMTTSHSGLPGARELSAPGIVVFMGSGLSAARSPGMTGERALSFHVYLLASRRDGTLYLGMTRDLSRRVYQHKTKALPGFSRTYGVDRLVWYEAHDTAMSAIEREKDIKKWRRDWKLRLIEEHNPDWIDLYPLLAR